MEATQKVAPKKPEAGAKKEGDNKPKDTKPRENKAGDNKNGENKPRENKPREGGDKTGENKPKEGGENKPRGPRPEGGAEGDKKPRGPRPEGAEGEKKKEFVKRDPTDYHYRKPYIKRQEKGEREEVTLETKIPELPKNNKKLGQPDDSAFEKQIVGIYVTIEDLYTKMNDIAKEEYNKVNSTSRETGDKSKSLRDLMTSKTEERKTVRAELDILQSQLDHFKVSMEEYYDKTHKYRQHMKKFFKKEDILKELNGLRHQQSHEQLSLQEEKKIIKEIAELEKALPYAEPLEKLENDFADQKEKKKVVKKQADELRARIKLLNGEITDIFTQLDTFRDALKQNKEEAAPTVKKIRDEYREKIQERKDRIQALKKEHDEQWQKYEEQQELIRRIQWMQRVQERLRRDQERQQRFDEEEKLRLAEEEEAKLLTVPFREEIELCDLLVSYLERLQPKAAEEVVPEKTAEEKKADIESALKGEEWSKVKVQLISSKKDADNDFFSAKPKKDKKNKSAKPAESQENRSQVIQHSIDILNYFDNVKISPPLVSTALPDAIKSLQDKKEYFQKLSDAEMLKPVEERTAPKEQKPQTEGEPKEGEQEKKPSKKNAKKTYEADDNDFPEIK